MNSTIRNSVSFLKAYRANGGTSTSRRPTKYRRLPSRWCLVYWMVLKWTVHQPHKFRVYTSFCHKGVVTFIWSQGFGNPQHFSNLSEKLNFAGTQSCILLCVLLAFSSVFWLDQILHAKQSTNSNIPFISSSESNIQSAIIRLIMLTLLHCLPSGICYDY